jgi:hypothetical protein
MTKIRHKLVWVAAVAVLIFASLYMFAHSMSKAMSSDEQMYCTGGYLISKGLMPYRDFSYVAQLPYHPLLLGTVYKLIGTTHYLLTGRIISIVCDILIVVCLFDIFRKIFAQFLYSGILLGLSACALFVFNPFVSYLLGVAWNHDIALLCVVLSFRIFVSEKHIAMRTFAIAALLTIAAWTRPTSVFFMPVFFAMIIAKKMGTGSKAKRFCAAVCLSPFFFGVIVFSIVPLWIAIASGRAFLLNIFTMPMLNGQLLHNLHIAYSKSYLTITAFRNNYFSFLVFTAVFVFFCVFGKMGTGSRAERLTRCRVPVPIFHSTMLALLLLLTSIIIAYFPPTMWKQYLGIPVIFIIIVMGFALRYLRNTNIYKICAAVFIALSLFTMINQKPIAKISKCLSPQNWTPIKIHNTSKQIVAKAATSKKILTLSPLYAIEADGKIYTELSAGVFAFRIADKLSENDRKLTHTAGVKDLPELIKSAGAVVIGTELTRFEKIDLKSTVPADWQRIDCGSTHSSFPPTQPKETTN